MREILYPNWGEWFLIKIKRFMTWYGIFFIFLILLTLYISKSFALFPLYLLLFASLLATIVLAFIPLNLFEKILPLSIPAYILFIHIFLSYTGGAESPYYPMYLMPLILASILFRHIGAIITFGLMIISHMILESVPVSAVIPYLSSKHFIVRNLPLFIIGFLASVMTSIVASMLEERKETISNLFGMVEKAKREWEASFDAIRDIIFILDREQHIVRVNKATIERFKKAPAELIGEKCYKLCHGIDNPIRNCPHIKTMETGKPQTVEIEEPLSWRNI